MSNKTSKWYKEIGGDSGTVKIGSTWFRYSCLMCARFRYPSKFRTDRWQGPPSPAITRALNGPVVVDCQPSDHAWALKQLKENFIEKFSGDKKAFFPGRSE